MRIRSGIQWRASCAAALMALGAGAPAAAQSYPIDCAILLCLSGGWPDSVACSSARAEFIRRITPWPVEPPLQIWRCPMAAADDRITGNAARRPDRNRADVDISGPEFDFVRSIRVYHVRYAWQREGGPAGDEECRRSAAVFQGLHEAQGQFAWRRSSIEALPEAHVGLGRWGENCPGILHRSVFVDWQDFRGRYGFQQVHY